MPRYLRFHAPLALTLLLAAAETAVAQEQPPGERPATGGGPAQRFDQALYKGIVGNLLDAVPMDAGERVTLQRTNAVASGAMSGKSLAALAGLAHPGFLIGGLFWGLWAASNIEPASNNAQRVAAAAPNAAAPAPDNAGAGREEAVPVLSPVTISPMASAEPATSPRPRVVRVWPAATSFH